MWVQGLGVEKEFRCVLPRHLRAERQRRKQGAGMDIGVGRRVAKASTLPLQTSAPLWLCPSRTGAATLLQKGWRGRTARKLAAVLRALAVHARRVARVAALRRQLAAVRIQRCFRAHRRRQKARRAMSMAAPEGGAAQGTPASRLGRSGQQATDRSISKHAAAPAARHGPRVDGAQAGAGRGRGSCGRGGGLPAH